MKNKTTGDRRFFSIVQTTERKSDFNTNRIKCSRCFHNIAMSQVLFFLTWTFNSYNSPLWSSSPLRNADWPVGGAQPFQWAIEHRCSDRLEPLVPSPFSSHLMIILFLSDWRKTINWKKRGFNPLFFMLSTLSKTSKCNTSQLEPLFVSCKINPDPRVENLLPPRGLPDRPATALCYCIKHLSLCCLAYFLLRCSRPRSRRSSSSRALQGEPEGAPC